MERPAHDLAALMLRASLGVMWITHGLLKLVVYKLEGFEQFLAANGLPTFIALPTVAAELIGGALILAGVRGRWVSLALLPVLVGATSVHLANGWVFSNEGGGWEYPVFLIAMSLVHALLGDGRYALGGLRPKGKALHPQTV